MRRVLASSFVGAVIEWYDFYIFGVASAAVFNTLFFPKYSEAAGVLASFATLALGYIARPLGAVIWGHFGDRIGRKRMLVLSIMLMGLATIGVGLLPTYGVIGIWAPVLLVLMRLFQGLSGGGEWGGAVLMSMEHAGRRRGLASSVPQMGVFGGILLANGVFALVTLMPEHTFLAWGWRVPFLSSIVLVGVGLWIRLGVAESPVFRKAQQEREQEQEQEREAGDPAGKGPAGKRDVPILGVLRNPRQLLIALALAVGPFATSAIYGTFAVSYSMELGYSRTIALDAVVVCQVIGLLAQPVFASLSDRIGRRPVVLIGTALQAITVFVMFELVNTRDTTLLFVGFGLFSLAHGVAYAPLAAWLGELFSTRTRYTGSSLGYQLAGTIGGGLTPLIVSSLLLASGGPPHTLGVSLYLVGLYALTAVAAYIAKDTHRDPLQA
ncbi:MHS family MFS transporter [Streptomyces sp. HNM0575]|nr:MHS family MFS transporter [Streptomyces sp. HNM0575]